MDAATASLLLCDELPQLVQDSTLPPLHVHEFVRDAVLPLERDTFQQVVDALRMLIDSSKATNYSSRFDLLELLSPIRFVPPASSIKRSEFSSPFCDVHSSVILLR